MLATRLLATFIPANPPPITITLSFFNVNDLLGFEVGDLNTGEKVASIKVLGWDKGPVRRHGNPSHGIALTPNEKELWVSDGHNMRIHVFSGAPVGYIKE